MRKILYSPLIRQYLVVVAVNLSVFTTGMSLSWPSPMLVKLNDATESPVGRPVTEVEGSWIVSVGFFCAIFSNTVLSMLLDVIGRKYCIMLTYIPKLAMGLLFTFASEVWMIIFGRAFIIMFDCFVLIIAPIYASEIASKEYRGALGTLLQLFSALGELVTLSVGPFTSFRTFNMVFTVIIALAMIPALFLPESPSFLYSKGRKEEAIKTLKYLRIDQETVEKEIQEYKMSDSRNRKINKLSLFKNGAFRKALMLGVIICMGTQFIGFNAVTFYLQTILISTGTSVRPEIASVIIGVIQVFTSLTSHAVLSSNFGRKTILIWSLSGLFLGMIGLGTFFKITEPEGYVISGFMNYLPLISLILVICSYIAGIGSLVWVIIGEIFDDSARAFGVSTSVTGTVFMIFTITKFFPLAATAFGPSAIYWFFSGMTVLLITFIVIFLPETKGKTFIEIQTILSNKKNNKMVL